MSYYNILTMNRFACCFIFSRFCYQSVFCLRLIIPFFLYPFEGNVYDFVFYVHSHYVEDKCVIFFLCTGVHCFK